MYRHICSTTADDHWLSRWNFLIRVRPSIRSFDASMSSTGFLSRYFPQWRSIGSHTLIRSCWYPCTLRTIIGILKCSNIKCLSMTQRLWNLFCSPLIILGGKSGAKTSDKRKNLWSGCYRAFTSPLSITNNAPTRFTPHIKHQSGVRMGAKT